MTGHHNLQAVLLALSASAILSFTDNFVAMVSLEAGLWQFQAFRALFALPVLLLGARFFGVSVKPNNLRMTFLRSAMVSGGLLIYFAALGFLPVAQAGAGLFSSPIWVLIFSVILFGNRVSIWQIMAMILGFVGVLMLLQPDMVSLSALSLFPLAAGALYGLGMLATRFWCANEEAMTLVVGIFVIMGVVSTLMLIVFTLWPTNSVNPSFVLRGWEPMTIKFFWLTLGQAIGAVIAVTLITQAYRLGQAPLVAAFEYSFLVFAALWSWILWGNTTNLQASVGIVIILLSGMAFSAFSRQ